MLTYSLYDIVFYFLLYGFLGWVVEVSYYSIRDRRFVNRGFLSLPLQEPCGFSYALLILIMPSLGKRFAIQFIAAATVFAVVDSLAGVFCHRLSRLSRLETETAFTGTRKNWLEMVVRAAVFLLVYHVVHPVFMAGVSLLPAWLERTVVWVGLALLAVDLISTLYATRSPLSAASEKITRSRTQELANRITGHIWARLERAYPGIRDAQPDAGGAAGAADAAGKKIVFAKGLCWDKIIWIFLICALLGDIIETFYCGLVNGQWMNRSSVLYGPFSFVWGIGAVVLTVALRQMMDKSDRYIFVGGFVIGGTYEYMCSVFTELVFGTVFWDYSDMPLNIGGRTNVLFCFFWGILAVVWVKILYPPLSRQIEKIPPLAGKIVTWVIVFLMVCNGLLTAGAMVRYGTRQERPEPAGMVEEFIDEQYDDAFMEARWPNMIGVE